MNKTKDEYQKKYFSQLEETSRGWHINDVELLPLEKAKDIIEKLILEIIEDEK